VKLEKFTTSSEKIKISRKKIKLGKIFKTEQKKVITQKISDEVEKFLTLNRKKLQLRKFPTRLKNF